MPEFHKNYWIGARKPSSSEPFAWFDPYASPLSNSSAYSHWGQYVSAAVNNSEPNNMRAPENCALANYTEAFNNSAGSAWGWADARCSFNYTFICKVIRE